MKIPVQGVAKDDGRKGFALVGDAVKADARLAEVGFAEPILLEGMVLGEGDTLRVKACVKTVMVLDCARCLASAMVPIEVELNERFALSEHAQELSESSEDLVYPYSGECLDLTDCLVDCLLTVMPIRALCQEDCKGLCPSCGQNLNEEGCDCPKSIDPRLNALSNLTIHVDAKEPR